MKIEIELDNLTAEEQETVKRLAAKKKPYWVPDVNEYYWYVGDAGGTFCTENNEIETDKFRISIGNCFRTREEAKKARTRLQMQTKWKRLSLEAGEADNPWDGEHSHWFVLCDCTGKICSVYWVSECRREEVFFPTYKSIEAAIAELGEENVKKYILGVEE